MKKKGTFTKRRAQVMERHEDLLDIQGLPQNCDDIPTATHQAILTYSQKFCGDHWGLTGDRTELIDHHASIVVQARGDDREAAQSLLDLIPWVAVAASEWTVVKFEQEASEHARKALEPDRTPEELRLAIKAAIAQHASGGLKKSEKYAGQIRGRRAQGPWQE
jgi:hypothetical protein